MKNPKIKSTAFLIAFLLACASALASPFPENNLKFGDGSASDKKITANNGSGANNPYLKFDNASSRWQHCVSGNCKNIGSGAGGGGAGINLLTADDNFGFEDGTTNWTASGGVFSIESGTPLFGLKSGLWSATASGQTLTSQTKAIPAGLPSGSACLAGISYKYPSTSGDYKLQVTDGTNVLAEQSLQQSNATQSAFVGFTCPAGNVNVRIISTVMSPSTITIDGPSQNGGNVQLGSNILLADIKSAGFYGSGKYVFTAACSWAVSQSTYAADFPANSSCNTLSVTGGVSAAPTKILGFSLNNAIPATYYVHAGLSKLDVGNNGACELVDDSANVLGDQTTSVSGNTASVVINGSVSYSTTGNHIISVRCKSSAAASVTVNNVDQYSPVEFQVIQLPTAPIQAMAALGHQQLSGSWNVTGCASSISTTSNTFADFTDPTGCVLNQTSGDIVGASFGGNPAWFTFSPAAVGDTYRVCTMGSNGDGAGGGSYMRLLDNLGVQRQQSFANPASVVAPFTLCADVTATSLSAMTLKLQGAAQTSGTTSIQAPAIGSMHLHWTVQNLSAQSPTTLVTKTITSNSAGNEGIERLTFGGAGGEPSSCTSSPCTIIRQSGAWISSVTRSSTGQYTATMAGIFSDRPTCTCTGSVASGCSANVTSNTTVNVNSNTTDDEVHLICMGPK